jgi:cytochrome c oxidase subunit 4
MADKILPLKTYLGVYAGLMGFLTLTAVTAFIQLGPWNTFINTAISVCKALLVVLFFMHVRYSSKMVWIFSGAAVYWIGILYVLAMNDYASRGWLPSSGN